MADTVIRKLHNSHYKLECYIKVIPAIQRKYNAFTIKANASNFLATGFDKTYVCHYKDIFLSFPFLIPNPFIFRLWLISYKSFQQVCSLF